MERENANNGEQNRTTEETKNGAEIAEKAQQASITGKNDIQWVKRDEMKAEMAIICFDEMKRDAVS